MTHVYSMVKALLARCPHYLNIAPSERPILCLVGDNNNQLWYVLKYTMNKPAVIMSRLLVSRSTFANTRYTPKDRRSRTRSNWI